MAALRLARARVGRPRVAAFAGSYHGSYDGVLPVIPLTHGITASVESDMIVLEYGNPRSLDIIEARASELSAVLVEPVQSRRPELQPREFLHALRALTTRHGIALIFDEVLVGFRIGPGGAQAFFDVRADIVAYGKIVGGGLPVGVVAGRAEYLDAIDGGYWAYGDASAPRTPAVWFAGTFAKNPLAMAAAVAALRRLRNEGPGLQLALNERTAGLVGQLREEFNRAGAPIEPVHFGSLMRLHAPRALDLLYTHLIDRGIYVWEGRSLFLSTEHTAEDVARLTTAVRESLAELAEGGFLDDGAARPAAQASHHEQRPLLFCFPYAGGSATAFHHWVPRLTPVAEVVPLSLPGRDARVAEVPITDYAALVDLLASQIIARAGGSDRRVALFGHSMGALLAHGVARKLSARGLAPGLLLVSGEPAPHISRPEPTRPAHLMNDNELLELMAHHGARISRDAIGLISQELMVLRADLAVCHGFRPDGAEPLDCPIVAFAGSTDPLGPECDVAAWAEHTSARFAIRVLPGDHFFIRSERERLLDLVAAELTRQNWREAGVP
jgi:surfactin synthase thioesterase subunit